MYLIQLHDERASLQKRIADLTKQVNYEDGPRRQELVEQIDRISDTIQWARDNDFLSIADRLVLCIQQANRERHSNRVIVDDLQKELKASKLLLQAINRVISKLEQ